MEVGPPLKAAFPRTEPWLCSEEPMAGVGSGGAGADPSPNDRDSGGRLARWTIQVGIKQALDNNERRHLDRAAQGEAGMKNFKHRVDTLRFKLRDLQGHSEVIEKGALIWFKRAIGTHQF